MHTRACRAWREDKRIGDAATHSERAEKISEASSSIVGVAGAFDGACILAMIGREDDALRLLEKALVWQPGTRDWVRHDPRFNRIAHRPRFVALARPAKPGKRARPSPPRPRNPVRIVISEGD